MSAISTMCDGKVQQCTAFWLAYGKRAGVVPEEWMLAILMLAASAGQCNV
jgi:hypothetical protein